MNNINSKKNIKKIVYTQAYGCYGMKFELSRTYIVFEPKRITYFNEPLDNYSNKKNCYIKVSYCPFNNDGFDESLNFDLENQEYDFNKIYAMVEDIIKSHINDYDICDVIPASLSIYFVDGKKKSVSHLAPKETSFLDEVVDILAPESFKKATSNYDEDEEE